MWCHKFQMKIVKHCSFFPSISPSHSVSLLQRALVRSVSVFFVFFFFCVVVAVVAAIIFVGLFSSLGWIGSRLNIYVTFFRRMDKRRIVCVCILGMQTRHHRYMYCTHAWAWENICSAERHIHTCRNKKRRKKTEAKMINHEWSMEKTKVYIELKYTNALVVQFDDTPNSGVMIK